MSAEVLAVIPARGGSKGLPRKNVLDLGGIPLVAWSIRAALAAPSVTRVVVSTDDEEIAATAREHGAEAPFLRPADLAGDRSNVMDSVLHVLRTLEETQGYRPDAFCTLYPTHPFRAPGLVEELTRILASRPCIVVTGRRLETGPRSHLVRQGDGYAFMDPGPVQGCVFRPYGVYEGKPAGLGAGETHVHLLDNPVELMDIDDARDLELARAVVRNNLFPVPEAPCA
ncbi:acylneuraminate cytidylyltransferase family protein [Desulfocurvus sp. DL9XJH121]